MIALVMRIMLVMVFPVQHQQLLPLLQRPLQLPLRLPLLLPLEQQQLLLPLLLQLEQQTFAVRDGWTGMSPAVATMKVNGLKLR